MDNPLVQPDPGLFLWSIITFLVLLGLLAKFAWKPLLQALESRQQAIRKSLDDAQQAKVELEKLQQESARMTAQARAEADAIISRSRSDGDALREEMKQKARVPAIATTTMTTRTPKKANPAATRATTARAPVPSPKRTLPPKPPPPDDPPP